MSDLFNFIEGFGKNEKWGDPFKMNGIAVIVLEKVRYVFRLKYDPDASFVIHCGFETDGHTPNSQHYNGNAEDFHIKTSLSFLEQYHALLEIFSDLQIAQEVGFGIYPDWNSPGFHLDVRGKFARWGYIDGKQASLDATRKHAEDKENI